MPYAPSVHSATRPVLIDTGTRAIAGDLTLSDQAAGLVLFAHGSGSGRLSPRNRSVADVLVRAHLDTLLIDLLTEAEAVEDGITGDLRFDIDFLRDRVAAAVDWVRSHPTTARLPIGLFGARTGAAAALAAAARRPRAIGAVVSRGGRPDLAGEALAHVAAPTLLIVGSLDVEVLALNRLAMGRLVAPARLEVVPGASHLFEEPGTLEQAAALTAAWFRRYLTDGAASPDRFS